MRILFVTPYVPSHIRTRPYHLIKALLDMGHRLVLITAAGTGPEDKAECDQLAAWGVQVEAFPVTRVRSLLNCVRALPTDEPLQAVYSYHPRMEQCIRRLLDEQPFDAVHIEHLRASRLVRAVGRMPVVYDSVDSISLLFEQTIRTTRQLSSRLLAQMDLDRTRRYEAHLLARYGQVAVTSGRDKEALESLARSYLPASVEPDHITVVTNGVDLDYFAPQPVTRSDHTVVFTGKMSYHANVAAAIYFAEQVLPLIWSQRPEVRMQIVGKDPPDRLRQLSADERIEITGTVPDLRPYLAQGTVSVCPVLYAVGIQNKILEAMAMGTPVVSSPAGCAGVAAASGQELLTAETPAQMAEAVLQVIQDPALADRLSRAGRRYVETRHSWAASAQEFSHLYEKAIRLSARPVLEKSEAG